jgi:Ca2+-transporting ATPase
MSIFTVYVEAVNQAASKEVAYTMGFVIFSLSVIVLALSARSETGSAFNREILKNRHQLMLYGISLLMIILPIQLDFLKKFLGLTDITGNQWLICIAFAIALLLVDEVIKFFMRRSRK